MPSPAPLSVSSARRVLDYDQAVFARFERRVRRLPKRGAFEERETGHHTYFRTLVHILHVRDAWFNFVILGGGKHEKTFFERPERYPKDWAGFDRFAPTVWAGHAALRASLTPRRLGAPVKAYWMRGRYTLGDAILQVSYEQAHHLGEIIGALWQQERPSPDMTWIEVSRDDVGVLGPRRRAGRST